MRGLMDGWMDGDERQKDDQRSFDIPLSNKRNPRRLQPPLSRRQTITKDGACFDQQQFLPLP